MAVCTDSLVERFSEVLSDLESPCSVIFVSLEVKQMNVVRENLRRSRVVTSGVAINIVFGRMS